MAGQDLVPVEGIISRLKAKLKFTAETDRWLAVSGVDNPMFEQLEDLRTSVAQELSQAVGTTVTNSNVTVCASFLVNGGEYVETAEKQTGILGQPFTS